MPSKSLSFVLLSAVTTPERAAAIEGDLLEEREIHGTRWFALHVIRTTLALFGLTLTQAPFRTAALAAVAATISWLMCALVGRAFFAPQALIASPLLGLGAIVVSAVLIGVALVHFAGALGVRAAVATSVLLLLLFVVTQASAGLEKALIGEASSIGLLYLFGSFGVKLGLGLCVYQGPLLIASGCAHVRRL